MKKRQIMSVYPFDKQMKQHYKPPDEHFTRVFGRKTMSNERCKLCNPVINTCNQEEREAPCRKLKSSGWKNPTKKHVKKTVTEALVKKLASKRKLLLHDQNADASSYIQPASPLSCGKKKGSKMKLHDNLKKLEASPTIPDIDKVSVQTNMNSEDHLNQFQSNSQAVSTGISTPLRLPAASVHRALVFLNDSAPPRHRKNPAHLALDTSIKNPHTETKFDVILSMPCKRETLLQDAGGYTINTISSSSADGYPVNRISSSSAGGYPVNKISPSADGNPVKTVVSSSAGGYSVNTISPSAGEYPVNTISPSVGEYPVNKISSSAGNLQIHTSHVLQFNFPTLSRVMDSQDIQPVKQPATVSPHAYLEHYLSASAAVSFNKGTCSIETSQHASGHNINASKQGTQHQGSATVSKMLAKPDGQCIFASDRNMCDRLYSQEQKQSSPLSFKTSEKPQNICSSQDADNVGQQERFYIMMHLLKEFDQPCLLNTGSLLAAGNERINKNTAECNLQKVKSEMDVATTDNTFIKSPDSRKDTYVNNNIHSHESTAYMRQKFTESQCSANPTLVTSRPEPLSQDSLHLTSGQLEVSQAHPDHQSQSLRSKVCTFHSQTTAGRQPYQSCLDNNVNPQQPLSSLLNLGHFPFIDSYCENQDTSSVNSTGNRPSQAHKNTHSAVPATFLQAHMISGQTSFAANEKTSHQSGRGREKSLMDGQLRCTSLFKSGCTVHKTCLQPHSPEAAHSCVKSCFVQTELIQQSQSKSERPENITVMPEQLSQVMLSPADIDNAGNHKSKMDGQLTCASLCKCGSTAHETCLQPQAPEAAHSSVQSRFVQTELTQQPQPNLGRRPENVNISFDQCVALPVHFMVMSSDRIVKEQAGASVPSPHPSLTGTMSACVLLPRLTQTGRVGTSVSSPHLSQIDTLGMSMPSPHFSQTDRAGSSVPFPYYSQTYRAGTSISSPHLTQTDRAGMSIPLPHTSQTNAADMSILLPHFLETDKAVMSIPYLHPSHSNAAGISVPSLQHSHSNTAGLSGPSLHPSHSNTPDMSIHSLHHSHSNTPDMSIHSLQPSHSNTAGMSVPSLQHSHSNTAGMSIHSLQHSHSNTAGMSVPSLQPSHSNTAGMSVPSLQPSHSNTAGMSIHSLQHSHSNTAGMSVPSLHPSHSNTAGLSVPSLHPSHSNTAGMSVPSLQPSHSNTAGMSVPSLQPSHSNTAGMSVPSLHPSHSNTAGMSVPSLHPSHSNTAGMSVPLLQPSHSNTAGMSVPSLHPSHSNTAGMSVPLLQPSHSNTAVMSIHSLHPSHSNTAGMSVHSSHLSHSNKTFKSVLSPYPSQTNTTFTSVLSPYPPHSNTPVTSVLSPYNSQTDRAGTSFLSPHPPQTDRASTSVLSPHPPQANPSRTSAISPHPTHTVIEGTCVHSSCPSQTYTTAISMEHSSTSEKLPSRKVASHHTNGKSSSEDTDSRGASTFPIMVNSVPLLNTYSSGSTTTEFPKADGAKSIKYVDRTEIATQMSMHSLADASNFLSTSPEVAEFCTFCQPHSEYNVPQRSEKCTQTQEASPFIQNRHTVERMAVLEEESERVILMLPIKCSPSENASVATQTSKIPSLLARGQEKASAIKNVASDLRLVNNGDLKRKFMEESDKTKIAVAVPPPFFDDPLEAQPSCKMCRPQTFTASRKPQFISQSVNSHHVSSCSFGSNASSFSKNDQQDLPLISSDTSLTGKYEYTIVASLPGTEDSSAVLCRSEAMTADAIPVKTEADNQEVSLKPGEVIDLCDSDSEDELKDNETLPCVESASDGFRYTTQPTSFFQSPDVSKMDSHLHLALDFHDCHTSAPTHRMLGSSTCSVCCVNRDRGFDKNDIGTVEHLENTGSDSHDVSKYSVKEAINIPRDGIVTIGGVSQVNSVEQINTSQSSTQVTGDLSVACNAGRSQSIAYEEAADKSDSEHTAALFHESGMDSYSGSSRLEQALLNIDRALEKIFSEAGHPDRAQTQGQKIDFRTLGIDVQDNMPSRKQVHDMKIVTESLCMDHDGDGSVDSAASSFDSNLIVSSNLNIQENLSGTSTEHHCGASSFSEMPSTVPCDSGKSQKHHKVITESQSSLQFPAQNVGEVLASIAQWSDGEVSEWLRNNKLDQVCPSLSNLDSHRLQRMIFEYQLDPDLFYRRIKKSLGLNFFQTMIICNSLKKLVNS